jgi:subtilisin family serine protease
MSAAVRIGVLDSGLCRTHPHVGKIVDGITIGPDGPTANYEDALGHGTAVASIIHHLNPDADLVVVKIFDGRLATSLPVVIRAIDWCLEHDIQIINLSLGTLNPEYHSAFEDAVARTQAAGAVIVSALEINGKAALPGSLPGVIGVLEGDDYQVCHRYGKPVFTAPPYPRDIPGVPKERNLKGVSFAVGRVSARVASGWAGGPDKGTADLSTTLRSSRDDKFVAEEELSSRAERTRISCHAATDTTAYAAFIQESRTKFINAASLFRNFGDPAS